MTTSSEAFEPLWTPADLSVFLGICEKTLRNWRHKNVGPPYKRLGKHVRYQPAAVFAWLEQLDQGRAA